MRNIKRKPTRKKIELKHTHFFYYGGLMLIFVGGITAGTYVASTENNETNAPIIDVEKIDASKSSYSEPDVNVVNADEPK